MKKSLFVAFLIAATGGFFVIPGFVAPAQASKVKCRSATPPKGLKRKSGVQSMRDGRRFQYSDRPGWLYALVPGRGWVVMKCFGAWY